ncbi:threonine/serine exporter family protein [Cnuibacter physcomitrellae]|uniref:threonine/serine ThrE exporter family protein n=1 Tax=Cnuibacter physcomitrellae TaxID=1619308 RepID=UPI002175F7D2|nr:threonine/serine exporter family protein [Cnuibacter physcomitrellae]MCS5497709.1 threonine/serine exporter family protein [Cnuibacter physcomitrellae]
MSDRRDTRQGAASPSSSAAVTTTATAADEERLVADALATLHANGAESDRTRARAAQLSAALGRSVTADLGWNRSTITIGPRRIDADSGGGTAREPDPDDGVALVRRSAPSALGMNRVLGVDRAIDGLSDRTLTLDAASAAVRGAAALRPANLLLFTAACVVGACCLAIIFGVSRWEPLAVIAVSAGVGAVLRRGLAAWGASNFWQVGLAALVAGVLGSLAVDVGFSSDLRLAVVCPCMILVPGPHILNGSFDLAALRLPLGLSRLTFATVTLLSIGAGLIVGLAAGGAALVPDPAGREIPVLLDAVAAGVVAVCYGVFYSAPLRILYWPLLVGAAVHALRWVALTVWQWESWLAAGLACLVAGAVLVPISTRFRVPFAAVGFASVVSLMPGVIIFRALDGLATLSSVTGPDAAQLLVQTVDNANEAWLTVFAMTLGLLVPVSLYAHLERRRVRS